MKDVLVFEMPMFQPKYKRSTQYGYQKDREKKNLKKVLENTSRGYCMYCYSRIVVDGKSYSNLEHAIEKSNSDKLIECIPNIGVACTKCNLTFKRIGENNRKLSEEDIKEFETVSKCSLVKRKQCTVPCKALRCLREQYISFPEGKIILQPMGVEGSESREKFRLQYDVLNMEFQPASEFYTYTDAEKEFILAHISRFKLNDPEYRTRKLYEFIKNIIDNNGVLPVYEYNNLVVEMFYERLKGKSKKEILKICKSVYCVVFAKM